MNDTLYIFGGESSNQALIIMFTGIIKDTLNKHIMV